ncbi:hypothetical protein AVEN_130064-1 [Araneus ventricosus]|uniref:Uncharacterized protein n=1 Tax=Araneus ventricosus TaxID=182803 RepID=A0A4Y2NR62_ARAVE|nr:hypothetical protein AVEN_60633-1 [Araneus ventricosus]GBN41829.1 hypothetical protein AVEN_130064-1 [Araneus ventricosus]
MTAVAIASSTEAGVLITNHLATAGPDPFRRRYVLSLVDGPKSTTITIPLWEVPNRELSVPLRGRGIMLGFSSFLGDFEVYQAMMKVEKRKEPVTSNDLNDGRE